MRKRHTTDDQIRSAIASSRTMAEAARKVNTHFTSFKRHALRLGLYKTNQGRQGMVRGPDGNRRLPLLEILAGKHSQYPTTLLKDRLMAEGLKKKQCEQCLDDDQSLTFVLDHIDGNHSNHLQNNLQILCPNCHSKTITFAGRNKYKTKNVTPDCSLIDQILKGFATKDILVNLLMVPNGANYKRVDRLRGIVEYIQSQL